MMMIAALLVSGATAARARAGRSWVPSWTTANYALDQDALLSDAQRTNVTLRQVIRLSIGGRRVRVALSNVDGDGPLHITAVYIALAGSPGSSDIDHRTDQEIRFAGRRGITIPPGKAVTSDGVEMRLPPLARLSISMHIGKAPARQTGHLRSLSTSWIAQENQVGATALRAATSTSQWYYLADVEVEARDAHVVVAFGDSITDGSRSTPDGNDRWPDRLAERLVARSGLGRWAVANKGLAGNRLLADGYGPGALARFDRDVLAVPSARTVILLEGINDLGQAAITAATQDARRALLAQIISAYEQMIARAHAHGLRVVGATILPYAGSDYHPTPADDRDRQAINDWIRAAKHFDAVIDWDTVMRDPADPAKLNPEYDSGDHIHPSATGYRVMSDAIPLTELTR